MSTILLISPYWKEAHRWMASSPKLAELWQRMGYRVVAVCMGSETRVDEVSETLTVHYRKDVFLRDPLNFGIALGFGGYVRRLIRSEKPDIIVCNKILFWSSFCVPLLRLLGHKVIVTTDALVGMTWWPRSFFPKIIMGIGGWTMGWLVLLAAHRVVFFHPQPVRLLRFLGVARKSRVIPTGIDVGKFQNPESRIQNPSLDSAPDDKVTVTYVGRLESVKGVDDFLAAAVPLKQEYGDLHIQVAGWYLEGHSLVATYEHDVAFLGLRSDIPEILFGSAIFVLPSYSEGLSNALMEAMASGCACIASDVGGNRFLVQNGVSGFLFSPGDREALQAHLRRLFDDVVKRDALGKAARKRIEEVFDWKVVEKQYEDVFLQFLEQY